MAKHSRLPRSLPSQKQLVKEQVPDFVLGNPQLSVVKSLEFMRKMTVVAVSTIAYLRNIFPAHAFQEKMWDGQRINVLRGTADVPSACTLIEWIKSAFDLVHSHHLRKLIFVIKKDINVLEIYTFSFTYDHDAIHCDVLGEIDGKEVLREQSQGVPDDIANSVRHLLRNILVHTSSLCPLPYNCEVSMRLHLDDNTPEEVLPPCFQASPSDDGLNFPGEVDTLKLGKVETRFITFAVSTKTVLDEEAYTNGNVSQECIESQRDNADKKPGAQVESGRVASFVSNLSELDENHPLEHKAGEHDSSTTNLTEKLSVVSLKENVISCICECSDLFEDTIKCVSCSTLQHKACYKLLECHQVETHVCVGCHDPSHGKSCSVPELLNDDNRKDSALYRQALMYCCNSSQVSCKRIMMHLKVSRRVAEKIFQQLDIDGCFQPATNKGYVRNVKLDLKENILSRYFSAPIPPNSTHMDTQHSFVTVPSKEYNNAKRQIVEGKENEVPEHPPRRKILKTSSNLKNSVFNYM